MSLFRNRALNLFVAIMTVIEVTGPEPNLILAGFGALWVLVGSLLNLFKREPIDP